MLQFTGFQAAVPKTSSRLLEDTAAQVALNCDLQRGQLSALQGLAMVQRITKPGDMRSIFRLDGEGHNWLAFPEDVSVVRSANYSVDPGEARILWSDGVGYPKQTSEALGCVGDAATWPAVARRLGLPAPPAAPTVTDPVTHGSAEKLIGSRVYVYTYVNDYGEEGPPSAATGVVDYYTNADQDTAMALTVSAMRPPAEAMDGLVLSKVRIYRSVQGSTDGAFFFVTELDYAVAIGEFYEFTDALLDSDVTVNETLSTALWIRPPDTGFANLSWANNGMLAGSVGNKLLVSETSVASAWPDEYSRTMESEIVGLGVLDDAIVVLTRTRPYVVYGQSPDALAEKRLPFHQGCVAALSIAHAPGMVLYAAPDGIFAVAGMDGKMVTAGAYTREQWQALGPEDLVSAVHDGSLIAFIRGTPRGIMFSLESFSGVVDLDVGVEVWGLCVVEPDDALYLLTRDSEGYAVQAWRQGAGALPYVWRSGIRMHRKQVNYGAVRVDGDFSGGRSATIRLLTGERLRAEKTVDAAGVYRLKAGFTAGEYVVEVAGTADVVAVTLGQSVQELRTQVADDSGD